MRKSTEFGTRLFGIFAILVCAPLSVYASCGAVEELWQRESSFGWGEYSIGSEFASHLTEPSSSVRRVDIGEPGSCAERGAEVEFHGVRSRWFLSGANDLAGLVFVPIEADCGREELLRMLRSKFQDLRYTPSRHEPDQPLEQNSKPLFSLVADDSVVILADPGVGVWLGFDGCLD